MSKGFLLDNYHDDDYRHAAYFWGEKLWLNVKYDCLENYFEDDDCENGKDCDNMHTMLKQWNNFHI